MKDDVSGTTKDRLAMPCIRVVISSNAFPKMEGAGNAGCTPHPLPYAQNRKDARRLNTGTPKSSGTPCAMVLRLLRDLPAEPAFLPPSPRAFDPGLVPCIGGTGPHGLTVRASTARLAADARPSQPASRLVTNGHHVPRIEAGWLL